MLRWFLKRKHKFTIQPTSQRKRFEGTKTLNIFILISFAFKKSGLDYEFRKKIMSSFILLLVIFVDRVG